MYTSLQEICIAFMYCNTVLLEAIENFILANKRYVLNLCIAILYSWRLMKYCGGHNLPTNNVNTVTLFLMYRVIRISCLLRAILASSVAPLRSSANIALNKQEIRITRYIRKRVTVLSQFANYTDKLLALFDHLPPNIDIFYLINIGKKFIIFGLFTHPGSL